MAAAGQVAKGCTAAGQVAEGCTAARQAAGVQMQRVLEVSVFQVVL